MKTKLLKRLRKEARQKIKFVITGCTGNQIKGEIMLFRDGVPPERMGINDIWVGAQIKIYQFSIENAVMRYRKDYVANRIKEIRTAQIAYGLVKKLDNLGH